MANGTRQRKRLPGLLTEGVGKSIAGRSQVADQRTPMYCAGVTAIYSGLRINTLMCCPDDGILPSLAGGVTALELVDAAARVHHLLLAGVERVRGRGDIDLDHGVFVAI